MFNEAFKIVLCQTIFEDKKEEWIFEVYKDGEFMFDYINYKPSRSCPLLTLYYYLYIIGGFFMTIILYIMAKIVSKMSY
jgi:hypothetical protein